MTETNKSKNPIANLRLQRFSQTIESLEALSAMLLDHAGKRIVHVGIHGDTGLDKDLSVAASCIVLARQLLDAYQPATLTSSDNSDKMVLSKQ